MNSEIFSQISKLGYNVSREWLDACVEFCRQENPRATNQSLVKAVCDQWLGSDITDEGVQASPQINSDLMPQSSKGPVLQGRFCVQVQKAIDVGQNSAYSQLQTALKVRNENSLVSADVDTQRPLTATWEPKSKRMLKLIVSDGFKNYPALEFEPISHLNYPVTPGLKLELRGPIQVRRGVLLLKPSNVKVLGGHVTDLQESGSLVQQLKQVLGLDNVAAHNGTGNQRPLQDGNQRPAQNGTGNQRPLQGGNGNQRPALNGTGYSGPVQNSASDADALFSDDDEIFNAIHDPPPAVNTSRLANLKRSTTQSTRKVPQLAPNLPQGATASTSSSSNSQKTTKKQPAKKEKSQAPKKEPKHKKAPAKQKMETAAKSQSEAGSVWDDDDEAFLLCAEASDPIFKTEKTSQKRVPKIPTFPPNLLPPKKAKLDAFQSGKEEDPFPDDDALFCDLDSPQIKKEISTSQLVSQKKLQRIKIEPKSEPVSQPVQPPTQPTDSHVFAPTNGPEVSVSAATCSTTNTVTNSFKPYTYFVNVDRTSDGVEIIKGCIVTLASKLTIADTPGGRVWSVKVLVTDGLETLAAILSPTMIAETFGFTPNDYVKMEQNDKKVAMKEATTKLASKLVNFNGLLKVKFRANEPEPEIIEMTAMNRGHLQQLKNRLLRDHP